MVGISEGEAEQSVWLGNCLFCKAWQISDYADFVFHLRKNMNTWLNYWVLRLTTRICIGEHSGKGMQANMFRSPARYSSMIDWTGVGCGHCVKNLNIRLEYLIYSYLHHWENAPLLLFKFFF